jgi:hypothetical protein
MMFGPKKKLLKATKPNIVIENEPIEHVNTFKYLGLWFDSNMTWESHMDKMCSKLSQRLGIIRRIRNCLPQETAKTLVQSMVLPILDYGDIVWANCTSKLQSRLQRFQNRAGKLILKCSYLTPSVKVRKLLSWPTLQEKQHFHICAMTYKCYHGIVPPYLLSCFTPLIKVHSHNTRLSKSNGVFISSNQNNSALRKFVYRGGTLWNKLPENIKQADSFDKFKMLYKSQF